MIMNGIKYFVILLQVLHVYCSVEELRSLENCGNIIEPHEYPWLASLEYGSRGYGYCGGSVIGSRYVLTAAHCVTGEQVDNYGGLTGVRLGDFTQEPFCDYGTSNCSSYLRFGIASIIVHVNYYRDSNHTIRNDIALLRLDSPIEFGPHMKRVCLPFNTTEPTVDTQLTMAGWGPTANNTDSPAKRAVGASLLDKSKCEYQDETLMCAFVNESRTTCQGDSGGPLMYPHNQRQMVIEGIVSFVQGTCANQFFPTHYTRVREYLSWIENSVCTGNDCTSVTERKFPNNCGDMPMYLGRHDGVHLIDPAMYSWVARLQYRKSLECAASVINSRYVLTNGDCVSRDFTDDLGEIDGVRLVLFDQNRIISSDYGRIDNTHHQLFGIEQIIPHSGYINDSDTNSIALIRLNRTIEFGPRMKPICLPFGINAIPEPSVNSSLTVTGWYDWDERKMVAKRDAIVTHVEMKECKKIWHGVVHEGHICATDKCVGDAGSPLMNYELTRRRMFLEGIHIYRSRHCISVGRPAVYTRVRDFGQWLDQNMEM